MPIPRGYSFSSRSLDLFAPGQHDPRIKVGLRPVTTHHAQTSSGRGLGLGVAKLDSGRFPFPYGY